MVIIIFYSRIVPYKWRRGRGARLVALVRSPEFLLSSLHDAMFYSAVVLLFKKK